METKPEEEVKEREAAPSGLSGFRLLREGGTPS